MLSTRPASGPFQRSIATRFRPNRGHTCATRGASRLHWKVGMIDLPILTKLARWHGVLPLYYDVARQPVSASPEGLLRTLHALGVDVHNDSEAAAALRERREELWRRPLEPVSVAWEGQPQIALRVPSRDTGGAYECELTAEDGSRQTWSGQLDRLTERGRRTLEGVEYTVRQLDAPTPLPIGYHRLSIQLPHQRAETMIISAPAQAWQRPLLGEHRHWGVFLPLYALHRERSWGGGDFSDLAALTDWVADRGGSLVATLPMLAWLAEVSDDPSPYSPASRLFWNEVYLDVTRVPEFQSCRAAHDLVQSSDVQQELAALRSASTVDYRRQMELKTRVLRLLSESFFQQSSPRREEFEQYLQSRPELDSFARFRAVGERQGAVWHLWPERLQQGAIQPDDYDEADRLRHAYTQWQVEQQLQALAAETRDRGLLWYLDFPLGVNSAGYDVWSRRDLFATKASGGAPPDSFFTKGQDWGFPPLHPEHLRQDGYRYLIQSLRQHLKYARLLRIDHVMGLHRLYWVPHGLEARDGAYVRYNTQEMFAILVVESHRYQAQIVGENLGTVPAAVDDTMQRRGFADMYVMQYEANPEKTPLLRTPPRSTVASINTHDMPMFAAYWNGLDIDDRVSLGLMTPQEAEDERVRRTELKLQLTEFLVAEGALPAGTTAPDTGTALQGLLSWMASGPAEIVLLTLEDLWEETQPQNTPGTFMERVNWRRKSRHTLEELDTLPQVKQVIERISALRRSPPT